MSVNSTNNSPSVSSQQIIPRKQPSFFSISRDPFKGCLIPALSIMIASPRGSRQIANLIHRRILHSPRMNQLVGKLFCRIHSPSSPTSSEKIKQAAVKCHNKWDAAKGLSEETIAGAIKKNASIIGVTVGTSLAYLFCKNSKAHRHEVLAAIHQKLESLTNQTEEISLPGFTAISVHRERILSRLAELQAMIQELPEEEQPFFQEKLKKRTEYSLNLLEDMERAIQQDLDRTISHEKLIDIPVEFESGEQKVFCVNCAEPAISIGLILLGRTALGGAIFNGALNMAKQTLRPAMVNFLEKSMGPLSIAFISNAAIFLLEQKVAPSEVNLLVKKAFTNLGLSEEQIPALEELNALSKVETKTAGKLIDRTFAIMSASLFKASTTVGGAFGAALGYAAERTAVSQKVVIDMVDTSEVDTLLSEAERSFIQQRVLEKDELFKKITDIEKEDTASLDDLEKDVLTALRNNIADQLDAPFPYTTAKTSKTAQGVQGGFKPDLHPFHRPYGFIARLLHPQKEV